IRERALRDSALPEKASVDAGWLKGDTHINYGTLVEKGQIDDACNTEVVELGGLYDDWGWEFAAEARRRT
ncbi:RagB/SusD family nutrient uptake outer membrane protein, partial [Phocaeicola vulgatus]|nr:RagB/SusD family nutrient uptake outer membrane protein [Phocaeicola vulgatus]